MNRIIVNSEDDSIMADMINSALKKFKHNYAMKRDNCGDINDELREFLTWEGIPTKRIYGLYKVDTFKGWLDEGDFTDAELNYISDIYGNTNQESLEKFVSELDKEDQEKYLFIPHVFLKCDNLILDAASDMFNGLGNLNKNRYFKMSGKPVI